MNGDACLVYSLPGGRAGGRGTGPFRQCGAPSQAPSHDSSRDPESGP